ncbi:DUF273 domain containing protein [Nitzschia inconspicua]|uniref:DUF273 domain containing protein n=1 Tax=Nitzschia inconspicua TaxID=303405 RepID=A0A9K3KMD1_9STRA|nr:DUF273 domain containing protein [Nitzschia inconspicua]
MVRGILEHSEISLRHKSPKLDSSLDPIIRTKSVSQVKNAFPSLFKKFFKKKNVSYLVLVAIACAIIQRQKITIDDLDLQDWTATATSHVSSDVSGSTSTNPQYRPFPSIGIFVAADAHGQEIYDKNLRSIQCYGKRHGYDILLVNDLNATQVTSTRHHIIDLTVQPTHDSRSSCSDLQSFSFQRQCVATRILPHYDFLLVLDADIVVVNANVTVESILLRAAKDGDGNPLTSPATANARIPHVILEERFHTGEIMAATFILQSTPFAQEFLNRWVGFYDTLPAPQFVAPNRYANKFYHNKRDNPSLNMAFIETLAKIVRTKQNDRKQAVLSEDIKTYQPMIEDCHQLWKQSIGSRKYMSYLRCINNATVTIVREGTQYQRTSEKEVMFPLYLFRRGHSGLGRDIQTCDGRVSPLDVFVHNLKEQSSIVQHTAGFYKETPRCEDNNHLSDWQAPVASDRWRSMEDMKALMKTSACLAKATKIGECWPDCNITNIS